MPGFKRRDSGYVLLAVMLSIAVMLAAAGEYSYRMHLNRRIMRFHESDQFALLYARSGAKLGVELVRGGRTGFDRTRIDFGKGQIFLTVVPDHSLQNINTVSTGALKKILGEQQISPGEAERIISLRNQIGRISSLDELHGVVSREVLYGNMKKKGLFELFHAGEVKKSEFEDYTVKSVGTVHGISRTIVLKFRKNDGKIIRFRMG